MNSEILFILSAAAALIFMITAWVQWKSAVQAKHKAAQLELEQAGAAHLKEEAERLRIELQAETEKRIAAEKDVALARQQVTDRDERATLREKDFETLKQAAIATVMEVGQKQSSKLLEDHKRETQQAREQQEQLTQKHTQKLMENFNQLTQSVATIQARAQENSKQMETVMRALTHPGGAGQMAEAGLENALKSLGLEPERDFILQFHIGREDESNLRPDAVIFLSQDMVVVIDSKASKFLMELVEAEGGDAEDAVLRKLVASTHSHIDTLARKQYADAVAKLLKEKGRKAGRRMMVMYLPSEAMIERLHKADRNIADKCQKHDIVLSGPASLAAILSLSRQQIAAVRQDENQERIISVLRETMGALATALSHVDGVGKGIQASAKKFNDFSKSLNTRVLPKLRKIHEMGVEAPSNSKPLPRSLATYAIESHDQIVDIEADEDSGTTGDALRMLEQA